MPQYTLVLTLALGLLVASGCKTPEQAADPKLAVPTTFAQDTTIRANHSLSRSRIFVDTLLVRLIDTAVANNPDVAMAMERIKAAQSVFRIRKGALLPKVEADATASTQKYGDYTMEGVGNFDTNLSGNIDDNQKVAQPMVPYYFAGLRSNWELDLWGKLRNQKRAAYFRFLGTEQARNLVITTLVAEVSSRYYELLALDEQQDILRRNLALQDSAVRIAEVQMQVGRATTLAVQQFKAQKLRTQSLLVETEQQIVRTENALNYLLGRFPQPIPRTRDFLDQNLPQQLTAGLPGQILNRRPDVLQAELQLKANKADVAAAKAAFLPSVTLTPFVGYSAFSGGLLFHPGSLAYGVIGGATAPLLNRSAVKGVYRHAEAEKQEAYHNYRKTVLNAFQEVQTSLSDLEKLRRIYDLNRQETDVLLQAVVTSDELFKAGYANYLDVITAQRNALDAELNQLETKKNLFMSLIFLYRSSGGGWN